MEHKKFNYQNIDELKADIEKCGVELPVSEDISILKKEIEINGKNLPNSMGIHPMEGCDGTADGSPDELTYRRYRRFGSGGAGLLWVEANAVVNEGRANPRQIYLNTENKDSFVRMFQDMMTEAKNSMGESFRPYTVLQLTHSGRYSKPFIGAPAIIAAENPYMDKFLPEKHRIITDEELSSLEDKFVESAKLAKEVGFDAVDIKACHRYLNSELLSAHKREGKYGGSFENRTRFLLNIIDKIKANVDIEITLRINAYDAIPYPYGWGTDENDEPDLTEPKKLVKILSEKGIKLLNISTGNPYYNPHVGRPYDVGFYKPAKNQIIAAAKMLNIIREIQSTVPDMVVMGTGFSWFREYGANIAAGCMEQGWFKIAGFGRQAFAYPDFAKDIILNGGMDRKKCCIACSKCTEIMRDGGKTGCVIKDTEVYAPIYKAGREGKPPVSSDRIDKHI